MGLAGEIEKGHRLRRALRHGAHAQRNSRLAWCAISRSAATLPRSAAASPAGFRGAWREPDINVEHHKAPADERPEPTARRKFMGAGLGAGPGVATVVLLAASTAASAPVRAKSSRVRHCTYAAAPGLEP
jgi:hypothetical protein